MFTVQASSSVWRDFNWIREAATVEAARKMITAFCRKYGAKVEDVSTDPASPLVWVPDYTLPYPYGSWGAPDAVESHRVGTFAGFVVRTRPADECRRLADRFACERRQVI